jgi:hypothetical protein
MLQQTVKVAPNGKIILKRAFTVQDEIFTERQGFAFTFKVNVNASLPKP